MAIADVLFLPWPMWAKLSFILGGLFAIVSVVAVIVKIVIWKKTARLELLAAEQMERGEVVQTARIGVDMHFGIEAMEEEPEVEGVWNSRMATPLHTPPGSRGASPRIIASDLHRSRRGSSVSSFSRIDGAEQRPKEHLDLPKTAPQQSHESESMSTVRKKKGSSIVITYNGPSRIRDENDLLHSVHPFTNQTENSPPKLRLRPSSLRRNSQHRKFVIGGQNNHRNKNVNLNSKGEDLFQDMEAHRRIHSAESGLLTRKPRRIASLDDTDPSSCNRSNSLESGTTNRALSWPTSGIGLRLSGHLPQKPVQVDKATQLPQQAYIESSPLRKPCPSAWTDRTQQLMSEKLSVRSVSNTSTLPTPSLISATTLSASTITNDNTSIQSTSWRKINSGFEILPAGTLEKAPQFKQLGSTSEKLKDRSNEQKTGWKLQKRSRSGSVFVRNSAENVNLRSTVF